LAFHNVIISSGHLTDKPDRPAPRFPESKADAVRDQISRQLSAWSVGPGDLAICGGARGSDIIFAELCADRGAEVWLFISLGAEDFLEQSVRVPGTDWEQRFNALRRRGGVKTIGPDQEAPASTAPAMGSPASPAPAMGSPASPAPASTAPASQSPTSSPFERANIRMIDTAKAQASSQDHLYAILVWDEMPSGDGPGGTADFAERVKDAGGRVAVINPRGLS